MLGEITERLLEAATALDNAWLGDAELMLDCALPAYLRQAATALLSLQGELEELRSAVANSAGEEPDGSFAGEAPRKSEEEWPLPAGVPTYDDALKLVLHFQKPSVSFIQRKLQIGYNKACDYIEIMEAKGIVSRSNSAGVRTMLAAALPTSAEPDDRAARVGERSVHAETISSLTHPQTPESAEGGAS